LLADEKAALTRWVESFPDSDVQQLRTLIRNAKKDAALAPEKRNGRGYRELFQFIKRGLKSQTTQEDVADDSFDEDES
jgi:ribosome-associated protein